MPVRLGWGQAGNTSERSSADMWAVCMGPEGSVLKTAQARGHTGGEVLDVPRGAGPGHYA